MEAGRVLGRRLAVAVGCTAAIVSLVRHVPASVAVLRGAGAWLAVLVVVRLGLFALGRALEIERRTRTDEGSAR